MLPKSSKIYSTSNPPLNKIITLFIANAIKLIINKKTVFASHTVHYVPSRFTRTWHGSDEDWFKATTHTISAGYLNKRSMYAGVGFSKIYTKNHIQVYANNSPVYDLKLQYRRSLGESSKHWHLAVSTIGYREGTRYY